MTVQCDPDNPIEDTYVFDIEMGDKGKRLNKFAESLQLAENRDAFKSDKQSYMEKFPLSDTERQLIRDEDWLNLIKAGGNIYHMIRVAAALGIGLYSMGAQQLGLTHEEFLKTRNVRGAT